MNINYTYFITFIYNKNVININENVIVGDNMVNGKLTTRKALKKRIEKEAEDMRIKLALFNGA